MFNLIVVLLSIVIIAVVLVIGFNKINNKFVTKYGEYSDLELMIVNLKRKLETDKKDIEREIESLRKEENLKVKEEILAQKKLADEEIKIMKSEILLKEERISKKEENLEIRTNKLEEKEAKLEEKKEKILEIENELNAMFEKKEKELERISGLTSEEARELILNKLEGELEHDKAVMIRDFEYNLSREKERIAKSTIAVAINKAASDYVADATISVVQLPSEEMKGRIIGKEGRNIRALEAATGVDLIIDDTPEAVVLSSFDGVRREVARLALEKLIQDGRIHPTKIEELVEKSISEVEESTINAAEEAIIEVGIHSLPKEVLKTLGRLKYRTSFGQNVLQHSIEVAHLCAALATELGANVDIAKRAGLLHDIGKAFYHEQEGSHAINGAEFLKRHSRENELVINAVESHHNEVEPKSVEAIIVQAADAISAARPGARRETLTNYLKRLEQLEEIANSHEGIESSYAIQAGRELRLIVKPEEISDDQAVILSREVVKEIEEKMQYPGQIKVTVIRETRSTEYAK